MDSKDGLNELKQLLTLSENSTNENIKNNFKDVAKFLFEKCAIKKGNEYYLFTDIEFYFYNKNHKDIITHPRKCDAMQWYVNDFGGIDLTYKSNIEYEPVTKNKVTNLKPILTENSYFGGILIRGLKKENSDKEEDNLNKPLACAELFRTHDATGLLNDFPVLVVHPTERTMPNSIERKNIKGKKETKDKVNYIMSAYSSAYITENELCKEFDKFVKEKYRYTENEK